MKTVTMNIKSGMWGREGQNCFLSNGQKSLATVIA